jgi:hypothetical protein
MSRCVALCRSVAMCRGVLQGVTACCNVSRCVAKCRCVWQCVAVCCIVSRCVAMCRNVLLRCGRTCRFASARVQHTGTGAERLRRRSMHTTAQRVSRLQCAECGVPGMGRPVTRGPGPVRARPVQMPGPELRAGCPCRGAPQATRSHSLRVGPRCLKCTRPGPQVSLSDVFSESLAGCRSRPRIMTRSPIR